MPAIHIGTRQTLPDLGRNLEKELSRAKESGIFIDIKPQQMGKYTFYTCVLTGTTQKDKGKPEDILRATLSLVIATLLVGEVSRDFVYRMTRIDHPYLSPEESWTLCDQVVAALHKSGADKHLLRVRQEVEKFLQENDWIFLEGFLRFRLKDYFFELKEKLEEKIDDFLADKEYREFLKLLQYFVEIQEPRVAEIHLLFRGAGQFFLLDDEKKLLDREYLQQVLGEEKEEEIKYEDLLLSALITLSPRRVILHHDGKPEDCETLLSVFKDRLVFCRGCEICRRFEEPGGKKSE